MSEADKELVERLRAMGPLSLCREGVCVRVETVADRIKALLADNARMREMLTEIDETTEEWWTGDRCRVALSPNTAEEG